MKNLNLTAANGYAATVIRITLGLIILPHGAQHLLGWFGGFGFSGFTGWLIEVKHLPSVIAYMVPFIEIITPFFLILGYKSRIVSIIVFILFVGIIFADHIDKGFFMNWIGNIKGEGYEYHLLILSMCVSLLLSGSGKKSLDEYFVHNSM